jgi:hypothetical protein
MRAEDLVAVQTRHFVGVRGDQLILAAHQLTGQ